ALRRPRPAHRRGRTHPGPGARRWRGAAHGPERSRGRALLPDRARPRVPRGRGLRAGAVNTPAPARTTVVVVVATCVSLLACGASAGDRVEDFGGNPGGLVVY